MYSVLPKLSKRLRLQIGGHVLLHKDVTCVGTLHAEVGVVYRRSHRMKTSHIYMVALHISGCVAYGIVGL